MRVLIGGVGYRNLRDESLGPYLTDLLSDRAEAGIEVEDLSYGPVAVSHALRERAPYDRLVLVSAVRRGRSPGTIESYRWRRPALSLHEIQARVAEAVTGVISLDNLLIVCDALGGLPEAIHVVEVEPGPEGWGERFSPAIEARLPEVVEAVWTSSVP
jgi:hydrogenase maturation protease